MEFGGEHLMAGKFNWMVGFPVILRATIIGIFWFGGSDMMVQKRIRFITIMIMIGTSSVSTNIV